MPASCFTQFLSLLQLFYTKQLVQKLVVAGEEVLRCNGEKLEVARRNCKQFTPTEIVGSLPGRGMA